MLLTRPVRQLSQSCLLPSSSPHFRRTLEQEARHLWDTQRLWIIPNFSRAVFCPQLYSEGQQQKAPPHRTREATGNHRTIWGVGRLGRGPQRAPHKPAISSCSRRIRGVLASLPFTTCQASRGAGSCPCTCTRGATGTGRWHEHQPRRVTCHNGPQLCLLPGRVGTPGVCEL